MQIASRLRGLDSVQMSDAVVIQQRVLGLVILVMRIMGTIRRRCFYRSRSCQCTAQDEYKRGQVETKAAHFQDERIRGFAETIHSMADLRSLGGIP